jgi:undecaprenyl-diphosphatase
MVSCGVTVFKAFFLGVIQGLTEFLPVSSSGHLMLAQKWFKLPDIDEMLLFDIILHLATLFAVVIVFRKTIWALIKKPLCKTNICLVIATAVSVVVILALYPFMGILGGYGFLPYWFLLTAVILVVAEVLSGKRAKENAGEIKYWQSAVVGTVQGFASLPGFSRSGSTIAAALSVGVKRERAAEFSFLLSIPIIIASLLFEIIKSDGTYAFNFWHVAVGFVAAFGCGLLAVTFMLKIIRRIRLYWFSIYLVVIAVLAFIF